MRSFSKLADRDADKKRECKELGGAERDKIK
jgi:hypothetical protein